MNNNFVTLRMRMQDHNSNTKSVIDTYHRVYTVLFARAFFDNDVAIPGRAVVTVTGSDKNQDGKKVARQLIVDGDVETFLKFGFIPISCKDDSGDGRIHKSYINPERIKMIREYIGAKPMKYMILMDEINPNKEKEKPFTFITTDNILKQLGIEVI